MSRIGNQPVPIPQGVSIDLEGSHITVKGPKGELQRDLVPEMIVTISDDQLVVARPSDTPRHKALHGLTRSLVANMVEGVHTGFTKTLEIQGVGYRAESKPFGITLIVGYSHTVDYKAPEGVTLSVEGTTIVHVTGADKETVGQAAAEIRSVRPPEPYKGKGIRYRGEQVRRKAGKTGAK
ncbi:MAG: 50S ribosomal protein L6 [Gemmatimonadetes bacterium]|nr:50S ribosomal protein L6 [Gemmatimonadota bacterium]TDJ54032.1 MAG: 50S ribosomal protein L6 [Gemmatimonadota bacterium]